MGDPQSSLLALFYFYFMNNIGKNMLTAKVHLYDDTMIYTVAFSLSQAVDELQIAFQKLPDLF